MTASATSHSLLERARNRRDSQAWQRFMGIYEPWLRGWLSRHALQPADVDDVLQDILAVVSEKLPTFEHNGRPGAFRSWLRTILVHRVRHFLRGERTRAVVAATPASGAWLDELVDPDSALTRQWDQEHDRQIARQALAAIQSEFQPATWQAFARSVLEARPIAEVAQELGLTANAVYIARARVLARLRAELRGLIDD